ncbi:dihydroxyacetone kinase subunit L [Acidiphilium sp. AL]|uniref:dihydroxyacetone kinase subunit DhaL n=1 Tax=Acidiphilium sp. AL TaxID=2871704 RepID=UPI0021CB9653|nr:dihydroxyacetone kinase subunit DhaL [Acidiphilium sp. AL]MCU4160038.1 dihydroxyacetone kinase subunit L [Acidiphilium sp. AL]
MAHDATALALWLRHANAMFANEQAALNALDAAIGDGDHGANLARGFAKVVTKLDEATQATPAALFKLAGMTLIGTVGGASGPLYGTFFLEAAKAAGDAATLDDAALAACLRAGLAGVRARGKAEPGDKTMVDALIPAIAVLDGGGSLAKAAEAARDGAEATKPIVARKGRASYLGERAIGHVDPGATSSAMLLACLAEAS